MSNVQQFGGGNVDPKPTDAGRVGGGDVSGGKKDMEITGDKDLDKARDHVLHGTIHGGGSDVSPKPTDAGRVGGGDVSGGKKDMEITGDRDLDNARRHVLGGG
jgi:hypothetical protein